jgi:RimJ/RimL family protein N-acetyltransferase
VATEDVREVALPHGARLTVRPSAPADVDGLHLLYEALSADDRRLRFFSPWHPDRKFLTRWVSLADEGGLCLVAVIDDGSGPRLVGEAGYTLLPDGDGELAIAVLPERRGWLGAYLLDALLDGAARRGVRNVQADVLVTNSRMLALARARGYAVVAHDDFTTVRVAIPTSGRVPCWAPNAPRPRILVEVPGARWRAEERARRLGASIVACPGPAYGARCPSLDGEACPLAAGADVIVVDVPESDPNRDALVAAHRRLHPGVPVVVDRPRVAGESDEEVAARILQAAGADAAT